jgi:hypothetical protein
MDVMSLSLLVEMLEPKLSVNERMASLSMNRWKSKPLTVASRVGAALITLGGGR